MKGPLLGLFVVTAAAAAGFGFLNRRKKPEARAKRISEPKDNERLLADNAGWDDEKLLFGMSKSRETMFNEVCARSAAVLGANRQLTPVQVSSASMGGLVDALNEIGVVCLRGCYSPETLKLLATASQSALEFCQGLSWPPDGGTQSKALDGEAENLGIEFITRHSPTRWDIYPANNNHLVSDMAEDEEIWCPAVVKQLLDKVMKSRGWHINSAGFMPALPGASAQSLHRDTVTLFNWSKAGTDAEINDKADISVPDYYFTWIVYLNEPPAGSATQFIKGSHRQGAGEVPGRNSAFITPNAAKGDGVLFNGKIFHRGMPNCSLDRTRHALYVVFSAKWYNV